MYSPCEEGAKSGCKLENGKRDFRNSNKKLKNFRYQLGVRDCVGRSKIVKILVHLYEDVWF